MAGEGQVLVAMAAQDLLAQAAQAAVKESYKAMNQIASVFNRNVYRSRHTRIKTLFNAAAVEASQAMVSAYQRRPYKTRSSQNLSPYRNDQRFSGGKLLGALASSEMYRVTATGVQFINQDHLDREAKQWARLNFGAGARGNQTPPGRRLKMRIFGTVLPGDLGLFNFGPRPGFVVPPGFWSSSYPGIRPVKWNSARRGQDFFILGSARIDGRTVGQRADFAEGLERKSAKIYRGRPTTSLGIQGSRFLDAGVERLVRSFPVAIEQLISEWFAEARAGTGPVFKTNINTSARTIANMNRFIESRRTTGRYASFIRGG